MQKNTTLCLTGATRVASLAARGNRGVALVTTLSLLLLVTIAAVAFLVRATGNRKIEISRSNQVLVEQLAESAAAYAESDFLRALPRPTPAASPAAAPQPIRREQLKNLVSAMPAEGFDNLLRQSVPQNAAAGQGTAPALDAETWNAPMLLAGEGFASEGQLPRWLYLRSNGAVSSDPTTDSVGRFAFNTYETSGCLDANVAGFPNGKFAGGDEEVLRSLDAIKSTPAGADLTALGIPPDAADKLVQFRSPAHSGTHTKYREFVEAAAKQGFQGRVLGGATGARLARNAFSSRQDLLRYARTENPALAPALPYLTHFSAAPSGKEKFALEKLAEIDVSDTSATSELNKLLAAIKEGIEPGSCDDPDQRALQIAANLIDQWDADSVPTVIGRSGKTAVGTESLPGIAGVKLLAGKSPNSEAEVVEGERIRPALTGAWLLFHLWNPHQEAGTGPPELGLKVDGNVTITVPITDLSGSETPIQEWEKTISFSHQHTLAAGEDFLAPGTLLQGGSGTGNGGQTAWVTAPEVAGRGGLLALRLPDFPSGDLPSKWKYDAGRPLSFRFHGGFRVSLHAASQAAPFSSLPAEDDTISYESFYTDNADPPEPGTKDCPHFAKIDPRVSRSGDFFGQADTGGFFSAFGTPLWPADSDTGISFGDGARKPPRVAGSPFYPALLARNNSAATSLADPDGKTRLADSGLFAGGGASGNPFANQTDRPVVLNRPFLGVAEMGYASRGEPFRSLDFFTKGSAEMNLLDRFRLREVETETAAGLVNLNTPHAKVLEALLRHTPLGDKTGIGAGRVTAEQAREIAAKMAAPGGASGAGGSSGAPSPSTRAEPAASLADLARISEAGAHPGRANPEDSLRKPSRETLARALADVTQTSALCFFVDVVAQTGRVKRDAQDPALALFLPNAERRLWLSLAVDARTGRILFRRSEPAR